MKTTAYIVISRYKESVDWIKSLTDYYIIYNKGEPLSEEYNQIMSPNFGGNQYDIFKYIHDNYENLPSLMCFLQGNPFDHCLKDRFYSLIENDHYTPIFGDINYPLGDYKEPNDNWYLHDNWPENYPKPRFSNFDEYCNHIFEDYIHQQTLTFPPGSQIMVERQQCLFYSKKFWETMMGCVSHKIGINGGRDAHIVERSIPIIFENKFKERSSHE